MRVTVPARLAYSCTVLQLACFMLLPLLCVLFAISLLALQPQITRAPLHLAPWHAAGIVCTHLNLADAVDFAATRCKQVGVGCSLLTAACLWGGRA